MKQKAKVHKRCVSKTRRRRVSKVRKRCVSAYRAARRKKALTLMLAAAVLICFGLVTYFVGLPLARQFRESPEAFRAYVEENRFLGSLLMTGLVALQVVVAFIPGEPFELAAGFAFGWFRGTAVCLAGSMLASSLVYLMVKKWGIKAAEVFFPREKILGCSILQNEKRLNGLVFTLFLIPGTPKDLLTYAVGLTPMKLGTFLLISTLARIPSVITSTITGGLTRAESYRAALIVYGITGALTLIFVLLYRWTEKKKPVLRGSQTV